MAERSWLRGARRPCSFGPPSTFHVVDALLTNFHLPKSTLLMLVAAFCEPDGVDGLPMALRAYAHAVGREYRFFSYGDAMLIE